MADTPNRSTENLIPESALTPEERAQENLNIEHGEQAAEPSVEETEAQPVPAVSGRPAAGSPDVQFQPEQIQPLATPEQPAAPTEPTTETYIDQFKGADGNADRAEFLANIIHSNDSDPSDMMNAAMGEDPHNPETKAS